MTTTEGIAPHPISKEEGDARLAVIRERQRDAHMERLRARQRIENSFNDRRSNG